MKKIYILAIKAESCDSDWFIDQIISFSQNSIVLTFNYEEMEFSHIPSGINIKHKKIKPLKTKNLKLNYYLSPLLFFIDMTRYFFLFLKLSLLYRPEICWVDSCFFAVPIGVLRRLRFCRKSIYVCTDLSPGHSEAGFKFSLRYLAFYVFMPLMDGLACKLNDTVLNYTKKTSEVRTKFWGRNIIKDERTIYPKIQNKAKCNLFNSQRKSILFLGYMRMDSGLDIVFKSLKTIRKKEDFNIKIIGPQGSSYYSNYSYFRDLILKNELDKYVNFLGFLDKKEISFEASDCFCGINLLTKIDNPSYYIIPGKLLHYIQFLLPIITTEGAGFMAKIIKENGLGLVIQPTEEEFIESLFIIYKKYEEYKNNIVNYINKLPDVSLKEFFY